MEAINVNNNKGIKSLVGLEYFIEPLRNSTTAGNELRTFELPESKNPTDIDGQGQELVSTRLQQSRSFFGRKPSYLWEKTIFSM